MKMTKLKMVAVLIAFLTSGLVGRAAVTIISDTYSTNSDSTTGFALGSGVNWLINPPSTRITGSAAPNLRYYQTVTTKLASQYDLSSGRIRITKDPSGGSAIGRFTLSANGSSPFDFGPLLGATYASPTNPAIYDLKISMRNDATSTARFSFGIATAESDVTFWDFGVQLYRTNSTNDYYTMQKRIDTASAGVADINLPLGITGPNTTNSFINFLIHITDAGEETNSAYSSRVQVSTNGGTSFFYDTSTDTANLPNGFRFDGKGRIIIFDQAGNTSGTVFYDTFSIVSTYAPGPPSPRIWSGGGADDNWSTPDNWDGNTPANGDPLLFTGTLRQTNINDLSNLGALYLAFSNGGFSLGGNPFSVSSAVSNLAGVNMLTGNLSWNSTVAKTWSIASGSELVLNGTTSIEVNGDVGIFGGGTLRNKGPVDIGVSTSANPPIIVYEGAHILDGSTLTTRGGYRVGSLATGIGAQTVFTNGANFILTATSGNFRVGDSANPITARLDMDNSSVNMIGSAVFAVGYATGSTAAVTQSGGSVSVPIVSFSESGAGTNSYTIKNGLLTTRVIRENTAAGVSSIYFDNATVTTAAGASNTFLSGLNLAQIQSGGLIVDAQSDITISQALGGTGSLTKSNSSTVTLTGANTYAGNTAVLAGKLTLPTKQTNATGTVTMADGTELGVLLQAAGSSLSVAGANFSGASFGKLTFDLGGFSNPSAPLMKSPSLSVSGPVIVVVSNSLQLSIGQFVLVDYAGSIAGGFGNFTLDTNSLPAGVSASLSNNTANTSIDLVVTGVPVLRWTGATDGNWDGATTNWINLQNSTPTAFLPDRLTEFVDGASTGTITISGTRAPGQLTVSNNALPYVWSGGAISTSLLKKFGSGSVTRVESGSDLIDGIELNAGFYIVSNAIDTNFTTVLTDISGGTGTFVKRGSSTLTVSSTNNTFAGTVSIQEGTIKITADRALGSTSGDIVVTNGGTLDLNDLSPGFEPVIVSGAGVGGNGAVIDSTSSGSVNTELQDIRLAGDTTLGAPNGRWDIRVRTSTGSGPGLKGNGFNLTKVGPGLVSIAAQRQLGTNTPYWNMNLGNVVINAGTLAFAESLSLEAVGNTSPTNTITINSGGSLQLYDLNYTNPVLRNISMSSGRLNCSGGAVDTNVVNGLIAISGANIIYMDQGALFLNGVISGAGSLNIFANGLGRVYFNGTNTYSGDTTVTNGLIGGTGVIPGNLVMLGGTNSPGMSVGTLTVNGNATLAGTTLMEINRSLSPNCDRLVVGGTLTFGGTLQVVLAAGAASPQAGDVYQLFNKGSGASFTSISLPNISALPGGLSWNTNNLNANGSISVNGPPNISSAYASGGNLIFSGTGGIEGNSYTVLSSTNVALPLTNWFPVITNVFGPGGNFSVTNPINPSLPRSFFVLRVP